MNIEPFLTMFKPPLQAVCVVVPREDGKILTATRRHTDTLSLPGGKVDGDETIYDAAVRECFEETGIRISQEFLVPLYSEIVVGEDGIDYYCTAFIYNMVGSHQILGVGDKDWMLEEGIKVKFADVDELLKGSFAEYNAKVFENILKLKSA